MPFSPDLDIFNHILTAILANDSVKAESEGFEVFSEQPANAAAKPGGKS